MNIYQFVCVQVSLLVLRVDVGFELYKLLIIAFLFTLILYWFKSYYSNELKKSLARIP